jgi:ribulose-5-phosphate 4-epimerase/fuculose-1-phosphate aldolase
MAEGIIKFRVENRRPGPPIALEDYQDIEAIRSRLWQLRLIGHDMQADVGYGNISRRRSRGGFVISGTQTGHKEVLDGGDYVVVDDWDFSQNSVSCTGPCLPSSEALSHAALYKRPDVGGVIHVHSRTLWNALIQAGVLSTEEDISYGSEALYRRLAELAGICFGSGLTESNPAGRMPDLPLVIVTKGHQDGVFVVGHDLAEAYEALISLAGRQ